MAVVFKKKQIFCFITNMFSFEYMLSFTRQQLAVYYNFCSDPRFLSVVYICKSIIGCPKRPKSIKVVFLIEIR